MEPNTPLERIVTLEVQVANEKARLALLEAHVAHVHADLREIKDALHKQRGFISGVVTTVTVAWAAVAAGVAVLWQKFVG